MKMTTNKIVLSAFFIAVTFIVTITASFPLPMALGYINLSDVMVMLVASVMGGPLAFFIAGVSTMMADFALGYANYAFFTFFIKGFEALCAYIIIKKFKNHWLAFISAAIVMLIGYGLADIMLTSNIEYFILSVSYNFPQAVICVIIASLIYKPFKSIFKGQ